MEYFKNITKRVQRDTGLTKEQAEVVCKCFLLELSHELTQHSVIELPFIGNISLNNRKLAPNRFLKELKQKDGFYASKFNRTNENTIIRDSKSLDGSSSSGE